MKQRGLEADLGAVEIKMEAQPRKRGARARRRKAAERLLAELLAVPEPKRRTCLEEERFQDPYLFELLVEAGHAALPGEPRQAGELLTLATDLVTLLEDRRPLDPEIEGEGLCRALCLMGTARRLLGDLHKAEATFERAGWLALSPMSRGFFCRSLGVLRWDQGRMEEAVALLHHAQRRFGEGQAVAEEAVCLALLGLLHVEDGQTSQAAPFLSRASRELAAESRPSLAAHCWLGLAFCHAVWGETDKAGTARRMARGFYRKLREEDLLTLYWLEGRVAAVTGDDEAAAPLLESARRALIGRRRLPEATLATIDLGLVRIDAGRGGEVSTLAAELEAAFSGVPGIEIARGALESFAEDAAAGRLDREVWTGVAPPLRMAFRLQGIGLRPVPFA